jgi:MFS transporter, DHA1 family, staphyloferrin A biosynthesis exporter
MKRLQDLHTFDSLQLRDYRLLWLGQITTSMGLWMDQTSRSWLIYSLTHSPLELGFVSALRSLPLLLFGVAAGVVADRYSRKAQLIISQLVNAFLNLALATVIITGRVEVWHIYLTAVLSGTVQAFQMPARQALIPDLVGPKYLMNAISLNSMAVSISRSLGPAICGIVIQFFGVSVSYYMQGIIYAAATIWTAQIQIPKSQIIKGYSTSENDQSFIESVKEGFAYIGRNKLIMALLILALGPTLLGMPYISFLPIFAIDVLGGDASTQGLLMMAVGIGSVIGALMMASLSQRNGKFLILGAIGFSLSLILFSQSPIIWMAVIGTFLIGFFNNSYLSQNQTMLQLLTPQELRGRVLGIYFLDRGLMPLGSLLTGYLATVAGGPWAITIMGASCCLLVIVVAFFSPDLWKSKFTFKEEASGG